MKWHTLAIPCCAAALLALSCQVLAAPAPLPKSRKDLSRTDLIGDWTMYWGGQTSKVRLSGCGAYRCEWSGVTFVGYWELDGEGKFVIRETIAPNDSRTYQRYVVRFEPGTLKGKLESSVTPFTVRLERRR